MALKLKDLTVFIGRFSPFHHGHAAVLKKALETSKAVVVLIGSSGQARTTKNPFTFDERREMIERWSLHLDYAAALRIRPIFDHPYNDQMWIRGVQDAVEQAAYDLVDYIDLNPEVYLTGAERDKSTWYLQCFPSWKMDLYTAINHNFELSATQVRNILFSGMWDKQRLEVSVPVSTLSFLDKFQQTEVAAQLCREYQFIETYKKSWDAAPYAPTFVTTDAVVVQDGHVLLIERRSEPGKGLLALPGGFLQPEEKLVDGCLRELHEETKLKVPVPVLRGSIKSKEIFDHPGRSLRGRTITTAFLIHLPSTGELPKVKGSDDAKRAEWIPIGRALKMEDHFFEDHFAILSTMIGRITD